jgi:hypothetical protein
MSLLPKGKYSAPGEGNVYAKANEVIVKITDADTNQTFEIVEENCKPGFQSRAHYHIKAFETFYVFDGSADFCVSDDYSTPQREHACTFHRAVYTKSLQRQGSGCSWSIAPQVPRECLLTCTR